MLSKNLLRYHTAQRILTSLTIKQGLKYNNPSTVAEIPHFIDFHGLDVTEILEPIDTFHNFNEFFYRKLKPGARPCDEPANPKVCVSPADCRMMAFDTVSEATNVWIKGLGFSIPKLLGNEILAETYVGGSLAIFRLAPQDYHRQVLDVYGENTRTILTVNSPQFGLVTLACIGAMMVGSIIITAPPPGSHVKRTDEMGYFAFGGSTIVVLWQKGMIEFDTDLKENAGEKIETLVKVGMRVGLRNGK
ncbi:phosphatidylserine decarboxylase like protein [Jimgerdemannia flammicorona]|uniref:Phosphatidylserine decarboxylase like protein n=1 Tax=Jimgerdemannia flammicorona TaxID=994334 RepID=A0A432ZYR3_9FUNG|nr:phosphatidylserine decarboxylase like protein [Jimgerdemannia flammicorona]